MTVLLNWKDKHDLIADYWQRFGPFRFAIETGIWQGNGSLMQFRSPEVEYVAIERNPVSARQAWERGFDVRVGDSGVVLPFLLAARGGPALFWLDAHDSVEGGDPANSTPLLAELGAIVAWPHAARSVVLVDDMRCCDDLSEWPSRQQVRVAANRCWEWQIADDILRLTPWRW